MCSILYSEFNIFEDLIHEIKNRININGINGINKNALSINIFLEPLYLYGNKLKGIFSIQFIKANWLPQYFL